MTSAESRGPLADKLSRPEPPPDLEERVVKALAERGLLADSTRRQWPALWRRTIAVAAGIALFVGGALIGRLRDSSTATQPDTATPRYALLLYGGRTESPAEERERVREYASWARGLASRGRYVGGEKLSDSSRELTAAATIDRPATDAQSLAGFFIVSAATPAEADSIARSCPHIRHGGKIVVRAIEPT